MSESLLEVSDLSVDYATNQGTIHALDDVNLRVQSGEKVAVVGESGCGKSTLAAAATGLLPANAKVVKGAVRVGGQDVMTLSHSELRTIRGPKVARIPQDAGRSLNPALTIGRQFKDVLKAHGRPGSEMKSTMENAIAEVGLGDPAKFLNRHPHQLSGGMQQRALIAMALALRPELLLADEMTSALDVTIEAEIIDLLIHLHETRGMALVFISHNLGTVAKLCDRTVVMYAGQAVERGPVASVIQRPVHPYTEALLGAVPDPDVVGKRLKTIPGSPPIIYERPNACRFAQRCPRAREICSTVVPEFVSVAASAGRCLALDSNSGYRESEGTHGR